MPKPEIVHYLLPGKSCVFKGVTIKRLKNGFIEIDGSKDAQCLLFSAAGGVVGSFRCFAVLHGDHVYLFSGPAFGCGMLEKTAVLEATGVV